MCEFRTPQFLVENSTITIINYNVVYSYYNASELFIIDYTALVYNIVLNIH